MAVRVSQASMEENREGGRLQTAFAGPNISLAEVAATTPTTTATKKKKKKKTKKKTASAAAADSSQRGTDALFPGPNSTSRTNKNTKSGGEGGNMKGLCIARNKHWKYISSYHGPWLQLPLELLESLLVLNLNPSPLEETPPPSQLSLPLSLPPSPGYNLLAPSAVDSRTSRNGFARLREFGSPAITMSTTSGSSLSDIDYTDRLRSPPPASPPSPTPTWSPPPGRAIPPPIDPGVFRSVAAIRRLVDEAAELTVRTASAQVGSTVGRSRGGGGYGYGGGGGMSDMGYGMGYGGMGGAGMGRAVPMSVTRVHRLRALAVQKLAEAYKADEIASSVMIMQKGTVFDDVAERVLKSDPKNPDARYVHFFHEKIPSKQLAESTTTTVLDQLIADYPQRLEFYRTRGVAHCFKNNFVLAVRDFTHALKESRGLRRAQHAHENGKLASYACDTQGGTRHKKNKLNGRAPANGTAPMIEGLDGEPVQVHPSVLPDAPPPLEPQLLFHRASAYIAHALFLIEKTFYSIEGISGVMPDEVGSVFLSYIPHTRYGGTEIGNPDGPLGASDGVKARAYRSAFTEAELFGQVNSLLRKSIRDFEKFLAHFDSLDGPLDSEDDHDMNVQLQLAFMLLDSMHSSASISQTSSSSTSNTSSSDGKAVASRSDALAFSEIPLSYTTYHPLIFEAHFSLLLCLLILGEFTALTEGLFRAARTVAGLEGYPLFLPPRSVAQAKFLEILERLAGGWKYGKPSDALVRIEQQRQSGPLPTIHVHRSPSGSDDDILNAFAGASSSAGPSSSRVNIYNISSASASTSGRGSPTSDDTLLERPVVYPSSAASSTVPTESSSLALSLSSTLHSNQNINADAHTRLMHFRALLAPIYARLAEEEEEARAAIPISEQRQRQKARLKFAVQGSTVDIVLAWLAAVHLPELEEVAKTCV